MSQPSKEAKRRYVEKNKDKPEYKAARCETRRKCYAKERQDPEKVKKAREACSRYYHANKGKWNRDAYNRARMRARAVRLEVIAAMGGKCVRCGIADERVIQFHHPYGGGGKIRREKYSASRTGGMNPNRAMRYYRDLLAEHTADPESIKMLCANCHLIHHDEEKKVTGAGKYSWEKSTVPVAPDDALIF